MNRRLRPLLPTLAIALAAGLAALLGGAASAQSDPVDYDENNNSLIEISTLEQLAAIRHDLDGDGAVSGANATKYAAAFPNPATGMGCDDTCKGYELAQSLDFNDDASYAEATRATNKAAWTSDSADSSNAGWTPIGGNTGSFTAAFDGNGHTISNLYVRARSTSATVYAGLFGGIGIGGVVKKVGVDGGSVTGKVVTTSGTAAAPAHAGGLAGINSGRIVDSWANVAVLADATGPAGANADVTASAGGLVGLAGSTSLILRSFALGDVEADAGGDDSSYAGGLVGSNVGRIGASFAAGDVLADSNSGAGNARGWNAYAGGLVGTNDAGTVSASYATGDAQARRHVSSGGGAIENAGGLVGLNSGTIEASYSRGAAAITGGGTNASSNAGGLIGSGFHNVTASYWDTDTSGITATGAGTGKTTSELTAPTDYTDYTGIYAAWNVDYDNKANTGTTEAPVGLDNPWSFGTTSEYPHLRELPPMLVSVAVISSGTLDVDGKVTVEAHFDRRMKVAGAPSLNIAIGGETHAAEYAGAGAASTRLTFAYTIVRGDNGAVTVPSGSIALNGGTITDVYKAKAPVSLSFTRASVPAGLSVETRPFDTTAPSVTYKPPSSLAVGQRIRAIVPITSDTDIRSYALKEGSVLPRTLRLDPDTGRITGRPTRAVGRSTVVTIIVCDNETDPKPNCAEVTLKLPAIIDEEADAPPPEPQLPEVPPLDLSTITVGDPAPTPTLLLALATAGATLLLAGVGLAAVRRRTPSQSSPADWGRG